MTAKLLVDENLMRKVVQGILRRNSKIDILRVQQVGLSGMGDPEILEWAAKEGRVLLTRDFKTVPKFAYERLIAGLPMAGVIAIDNSQASMGQIIEDIVMLAEFEEDCAGQVHYIPF